MISDQLMSPPEELLAEHAAVCVTCPHSRRDHDSISARYCMATTDNGLRRDCICPASR